jgi:Ca2+-binding EF-hand superfamily protein
MEGALMTKRLLMCGALALGVAVLLPGTIRAQTQRGSDLPGPIDSIGDLQDTAKMLFKLADTNNDGGISQKEAVDVGNLMVGGFFFRADSNGDGVLTPEEARAARESLFQQQPLLRYLLQKAKPQNGSGTQSTASQPSNSGTGNPFAALGKMLDTNNNQKIEGSELRQAVQGGVQVVFSIADTNQDGQLIPAELNQAVVEASRSMIQTAFQNADADHNGGLTMDEFDKALAEPAHAVFRVLDGNSDNQLSLQELERAQQIIATQIQRLRVPEAQNSLRNQMQRGNASRTGLPGSIPVTPAPVTPAPVTPVRP